MNTDNSEDIVLPGFDRQGGEYPKIQSVFKRDMTSKKKELLEGQWTLPEFEYLANNKWQFTEKVDGTNIRVIFSDGKVEFKGRTDAAQIPAKLLERLKELFSSIADEAAEMFDGGSAVLYGEGFGEKIQSGGKYLPYQDFVLFDVLVNGWWLRRRDVDGIAAAFGIAAVPVIGCGTLHDAISLVREGFHSDWGPFMAEGIVARPMVELRTRGGSRLITKIKHRDFVIGGEMEREAVRAGNGQPAVSTLGETDLQRYGRR